MKVLVEGGPEEFRDKAEALVKALSEKFSDVGIDLADELRKARLHREPNLKYRVLQQLRKVTGDEYQRTIERMVAEINEVLDRGIHKSEDPPNPLQRSEDDPDPDYDEETGEPIIDPETGLSPSEEKEEKQEDQSFQKAFRSFTRDGVAYADRACTVRWTDAQAAYSKVGQWARGLGGRIEKAEQQRTPDGTPGVWVWLPANQWEHRNEFRKSFGATYGASQSQWLIAAVTLKQITDTLEKAEPGDALVETVNAIVDREDAGYRRIKTILRRKGYRDDDFEPGGPLYGYSTNELIAMVRPA